MADKQVIGSLLAGFTRGVASGIQQRRELAQKQKELELKDSEVKARKKSADAAAESTRILRYQALTKGETDKASKLELRLDDVDTKLIDVNEKLGMITGIPEDQLAPEEKGQIKALMENKRLLLESRDRILNRMNGSKKRPAPPSQTTPADTSLPYEIMEEASQINDRESAMKYLASKRGDLSYDQAKILVQVLERRITEAEAQAMIAERRGVAPSAGGMGMGQITDPNADLGAK